MMFALSMRDFTDNGKLDATPRECLMAVAKRDLVPGQVDPEHLRRLIGLTRITAESVISALYSHFVDGKKQTVACAEFGVSDTTLSRKVSDLNKLSREVRELAVFYR